MIEVLRNVVNHLGMMINKNSEDIFALKTELKAAEQNIDKLITLIDQQKNKKPCPRCKGVGSIIFKDANEIPRHEPCPYCLSKRTV